MEAQIVLYVATAIAIVSELMAVIPALKSNSVVQLLLSLGKKLTAGKE